MWMQRKQDILQGTIKSRARAHDIIQKMLASLGDPYTRFLSPSEVSLECCWLYGLDIFLVQRTELIPFPSFSRPIIGAETNINNILKRKIGYWV